MEAPGGCDENAPNENEKTSSSISIRQIDGHHDVIVYGGSDVPYRTKIARKKPIQVRRLFKFTDYFMFNIITCTCVYYTCLFRRKTPIKNKRVDARESLKRAKVEYEDDNACTSNLSKWIRDCESVPSMSNVSQFHSLDESVISFVDVLRTVKPVDVVEDVKFIIN